MSHPDDVGDLGCEAILARVSDYLDGELDCARLAEIEAHLRACRRCERFASELAATVRALRRLRCADCE